MSSNASEIRITGPLLKVLGTLTSSGGAELSGADIARVTKIASGTLYPILFRLERAGWLESRWESVDSRAVARPRRRLYRTSALGERSLRATVEDLQQTFGRVAWA
jgi:PadR family transcriptional regulator, regulatory protein PadR